MAIKWYLCFSTVFQVKRQANSILAVLKNALFAVKKDVMNDPVRFSIKFVPSP